MTRNYMAMSILILIIGALVFSRLYNITPLEKIIENPCNCSVAAIKSSGPWTDEAFGTGFVIQQNLIVTARHVVQADYVDVKICGIWQKGEVIRKSPQRLMDLKIFGGGSVVVNFYHGIGEFALIRAYTRNARPIELTKNTPQKDDECRWHIYGCQKKFNGKLAKVSSEPIYTNYAPEINFFGPILINNFKIFAEHIEIDSPAIPGSSGSPVLNKSGEVIGIISATNQKMTFGIASSELEEFMDTNSNLWKSFK